MNDKTAADPLLDDTKSKKKKKGKKSAGKKQKVKKAASNGEASIGRPASDLTVERRKKVLKYAQAKDGVTNIALAEKLDCTTAQSQTVCRSLVAAGKLKMVKDKESGRVVYKAS